MSKHCMETDEFQRLQTLNELAILDTPAEERYDRVTRLAQSLFGVSFSLISLVDKNRQWFKSRQGLDVDATERSVAFCDHAIKNDGLFIVPDAYADPRFCDNPLVVDEPGIRFYAGRPLKARNGYAVGTLCVIDTRPREMTHEQREILWMLGHVAELEINREHDQHLLTELNFQQQTLQMITAWQAAFIGRVQSRPMFEKILTDLLGLTDSEYGFIGEVFRSEGGEPYLLTRAITNIAWDAETVQLYQQRLEEGMEFRNLNSLFGKALTSEKIYISNSPGTDPNRGGIPHGHPPLHRFAGIPIHSNGHMVAMVGLANKCDDYSHQHLEKLIPLLGTIGLFINERRLRLQENETRKLLDQVSEHVPGMIFRLKRDTDGKMSFPYVSKGIVGLYGLEPDDVKEDAMPAINAVHPEDVDGLVESIEVSAKKRSIWNYEYRILDRSGASRWLSGYAAPQSYSDSSVVWHGHIADITEKRSAFEKISLASKVFSSAVESILITEPNGTILDVNPSFERTTGYKRSEVLGFTPSIISSGKHDRSFYDRLWMALNKDGFWVGDILNRRKSGEIFVVNESISAVYDESGRVKQYVAVFNDVTAQRAAEDRLKHIAHFDPLTELPNRLLLAQCMEAAIEHCAHSDARLLVAYLDLDGFKAINDAHGHLVGDQFLKQLSRSLSATIRSTDTLARIGGDEFVVLMLLEGAHINYEESVHALLRVSASPILIDGVKLSVSVSIGVVLYPQDDVAGVIPDQLLRQADHAMYQAKMAGKNQYKLFDSGQEIVLRSMQEKMSRISQAMEMEEFELWYQPKVDMRTGSVIGMEALVRWRHPDRGLLSPAEFLSDIERSSLAKAFDAWVLKRAARQIADWHELRGFSLSVSINIGAPLMQEGGLLECLMSIRASHPSVSFSCIEIEILETAALEHMDKVVETIEDAALLGVKFALDDFGTGYSALTYLRRLPVHTLKIDRTFIRDFVNDAEDMAIVKGIIGLASAFEKQVVAEGVETIEHGSCLIDLGCDIAQGYGIARPMPAALVPGWVTSWRTPEAWATRPRITFLSMPTSV